MDTNKQYLDYEGLKNYDRLIKQFIETNGIELLNLNLTEDNTFELYYKKNGESKKMTLNLNPLITEWVTL